MSALGAAVPLGALDGCALFRPDPAQLCERPDTTGRDLLIDIHAHVFNGGDLQIRDFISHLTEYLDGVWQEALKHLGGLLQRVAWHRAPSGPAEMKALAGIQCGVPLSAGPRGVRAEAYALALDTLEQAAQETLKLQAPGLRERESAFSFEAQATLNRLRRMPYEEYERQRAARANGTRLEELLTERSDAKILQKTLFTLYDFVIQHFQYRFANVIDYFERYEAGGQQPIDLLVTSFLDFDHWISQGRATPTKIPQQIEVMERISVLTGGRVQSFVPYCPLRELQTGGGTRKKDGESLTWVKNAILERGFIGVKLYPPMGFAPYGNAVAQEKNPKLWQKAWLPDRAKQPGFGKALDEALDIFYEWCIEKNVPIMAHTSFTNIMHEDFKALPGSEYWKLAVDCFPSLRIDFGHLGGNDENAGAPRAKPFVELMPPAANAYGDIGYFFDVIDHPKAMSQSMRELFAVPLARERLMYGSDYQMILSERGWSRYQQAFRELVRTIGGKPGFERDFFGNNAARYLGLTKGQENNRSRLETFYAKNNVPNPAWMIKVDNPPSGPR